GASLEDALSGGDDYQLLFASAESVTTGVCIGELSSELGLRLDGKDVEIHGYQHFSA
ncbi:MAG TPA: thiamine-phosphate kinase, partial [Gammaproteobacteria bacterium]|nr:thiamine-phosphate kinase [Gammaproteobacteria bacterium]